MTQILKSSMVVAIVIALIAFFAANVREAGGTVAAQTDEVSGKTKSSVDMSDEEQIIAASEQLAAAIGRRDVKAIGELLAPGFVHRSHGGEAVTRDAFLAGVKHIPGEVVFVKLELIRVDMTGSGALVTGIQHAQLRIDGKPIDDRRRFVDWYVKLAGEWRLQAAVDVPNQEPA
jgi:ketosteroid isomerase-like protein